MQSTLVVPLRELTSEQASACFGGGIDPRIYVVPAGAWVYYAVGRLVTALERYAGK